ncbi:hypothetical protein A8938_2168 [Algoriphagus zhangzhouensis]|uniref:Uncharacterized protein n=2 Tax=Algoriphagus zhangzhouensis TaxID=1073327 RepID=A0A1M7ZCI2_9BACT|nr:hypothetical protein A8938_2168 [Algoriphagus zhangzhouensis]SHO62570.1 hypothetical protein SAMN04488108_2166 [Algoriphagus zhangzhouensis]
MFMAFGAFSQESTNVKGPFLRIYDSQENKIQKGRIISVSEDFEELKILHGSDTVILQTQDISFIRTKRSSGHLILIGGVTGFAAGYTIGAITYDPSPDAWLDFGYGFNTMVPALFFGLGGAAAGSIATGFKKPRMYVIDGRSERLKDFLFELSLVKKNKKRPHNLKKYESDGSIFKKYPRSQ